SAGLAEGLAMIDAIAGLDGYYLLHAARADILMRMGRWGEAAEAYRRALALATNRVEQEFLRRRLTEIGKLCWELCRANLRISVRLCVERFRPGVVRGGVAEARRAASRRTGDPRGRRPPRIPARESVSPAASRLRIAVVPDLRPSVAQG